MKSCSFVDKITTSTAVTAQRGSNGGETEHCTPAVVTVLPGAVPNFLEYVLLIAPLKQDRVSCFKCHREKPLNRYTSGRGSL